MARVDSRQETGDGEIEMGWKQRRNKRRRITAFMRPYYRTNGVRIRHGKVLIPASLDPGHELWFWPYINAEKLSKEAEGLGLRVKAPNS